MTNLLKETKNIIRKNDAKLEEVKWVGSEEFGWFTWEDFEKLADVEYYAGYGAVEVAEDLLVVGETWWLERHKYDGSEWWEFKTVPDKPNKYRKPESLVTDGIGWEVLTEINDKILSEDSLNGVEKED